MGALAALGVLLLVASVWSEDSPKGPKVTHKVSTYLLLLHSFSSI